MASKAFLAAIDDYAPAGPGGPDLHGCVNDARDMANTLVVLGVVPALPPNLRLITNQNATRAAILNGLKWLIQGSEAGDRRIFYYSGHGTRVVDRWPRDEVDGYDEAICPFDYATAGVITDDEIGALLATVPRDVRFELIVDSCHSGTVTRDLGSVNVLAVRSVPPPFDQDIYLELNPQAPLVSPLKSRGMRELKPAPLNHVLWAACRDSQVSQEISIGGVPRGVFTYCFCKVLRSAGTSALRYVIDSQVTKDVKAMVGNQVPQLEASRAAMSKAIFGPTREIAEERKSATVAAGT